MTQRYTPAERRLLEERLARGARVCPRCGTALELRPVPPRGEVAYVRDRVWLLCSGCGGSIVLDLRRIERSALPHPAAPDTDAADPDPGRGNAEAGTPDPDADPSSGPASSGGG